MAISVIRKKNTKTDNTHAHTHFYIYIYVCSCTFFSNDTYSQYCKHAYKIQTFLKMSKSINNYEIS